MRIHVLEDLSGAGAIGGLNNSAGAAWEGFGASDAWSASTHLEHCVYF